MNIPKIANAAATVASVLVTLVILWNCVTTGNWLGGIVAWLVLAATNFGFRAAIAKRTKSNADLAAYRAFKAEHPDEVTE